MHFSRVKRSLSVVNFKRRIASFTLARQQFSVHPAHAYVCYPAWQSRRDRPFLTSRLRRSVRKQPGRAGSAMLDRGSRMHLRRTLFSAHVTRGQGTVQCPLKEGKEQSNVRLKEGRNGFICIKHSRLRISRPRNKPVLTIEAVT